MALALPLFVELFQSIQAMVDWLAGGPAPQRGSAVLRSAPPGACAPALRINLATRASQRTASPVSAVSPALPATPDRHWAGPFRAQPAGRSQRVVHVVNAAQSRRARGMVLSGPIDEVCAELDRLAALDCAH